jgi:hypothetical protein
MNATYAYHFLPADRKLRYSDEPVEVGRTYTVKPPVELCKLGLHGSRRITDALGYAPGPVLCRTLHSGMIVYGSDKLCSSERKILWMLDLTRALQRFAYWCAVRALNRCGVKDPRSLEALRITALWLDGKATDEEQQVARTDAYVAAHAATDAAERDEQEQELLRMVRKKRRDSK